MMILEENSNSSPATPLDASTVILLRETPSANPFEVLLMPRHSKQNFMGNAFVYPGGQLDEEDCNPKLADYASGMSAEEAKRRLNEPDISDERALGLFFAAVRETFEESGVLLAVPVSGGSIDFTDPEIRKRFAPYRHMIHQHEMTLLDLAKKEKLVFSLDQLTPFAHWITPEIELRRFDTRFLLARMPSGQAAVHDAMEMTETLWTTPEDAFLKQKSGEILLMPPTLKTLEEMAQFSSVSKLFSFASSRNIQTVLPQVLSDGEVFGVKLPHDPEYSNDKYKQPHRPEETSRIVLVDGRFKAIKFGK
jgi:8-oxo-dGTP pyrophosphatase MutT (NUDIX family)